MRRSCRYPAGLLCRDNRRPRIYGHFGPRNAHSLYANAHKSLRSIAPEWNLPIGHGPAEELVDPDDWTPDGEHYHRAASETLPATARALESRGPRVVTGPMTIATRYGRIARRNFLSQIIAPNQSQKIIRDMWASAQSVPDAAAINTSSVGSLAPASSSLGLEKGRMRLRYRSERGVPAPGSRCKVRGYEPVRDYAWSHWKFY